jgi:flagellar L-ring protein precursor FlgH
MRKVPRIAMLRTAMLVLAVSLSGCAVHKQPAPSMPATSAPRPVAEQPHTAGSLWTNRQGSLFVDLKARQIGDIVTVAIYEEASASKEAQTSTGRSSNMSAGIGGFFGLEGKLAGLNKYIDPSELVSADYENDFSGTGSTSRKEDLVATLTTRVVEVFANGNLRIEGGKTVRVNNENQIIMLSGIVRSEDISPQNVVSSRYILDANIAYTGKGVLSDKQRPGWMTRILDNVWPF